MVHQQTYAPLEMIRGSDYSFRIKFTQLDEEVDITGATIVVAFKLNSWDVADVFTKTTPTQVEILNQTTATGEARVHIETTDTLVLPNRETVLWFDVDITTPDGAFSPLAAQQLIVKGQVTP